MVTVRSTEPPALHDWAVELVIDGRLIDSLAVPRAAQLAQLPIEFKNIISMENGKKMQGQLTFAALVSLVDLVRTWGIVKLR